MEFARLISEDSSFRKVTNGVQPHTRETTSTPQRVDRCGES